MINNKSVKEILELKKQGYIKGSWFWFWGILILVYFILALVSSTTGDHKATQQELQKIDSKISSQIEILADSVKQNQIKIEKLDSSVTKGREEAIDKISGKLDRIEKLILREAPKKKK